jgi:hypothetical protein
MSTIRKPSEWIIEALTDAGIPYTVLPDAHAARTRTVVNERYAVPGETPLWERFSDCRSVYDPLAWSKIDGLIAEDSYLLFFDDTEDTSLILLQKGVSLSKVLAACPGFEFYVTDEEISYVLALNHHDCLLGIGTVQNSHLFRGSQAHASAP